MIIALLMFFPLLSVASPCDCAKKTLTNREKTMMASIIAKQLNVPHLEVRAEYRIKQWRIVNVVPPEADDVYLFYANDPSKNHYITLWGGAASKFEENNIKKWVLRNVPGIPDKLATCFAWHVTNDTTLSRD